jgi:hypothetical protein
MSEVWRGEHGVVLPVERQGGGALLVSFLGVCIKFHAEFDVRTATTLLSA